MNINVPTLLANIGAPVATLIGVVFWTGSQSADIKNTKAQVEATAAAQAADHDKVIKQDQKLTDIASDVAEIKSDVKSILQKSK